MTTRKTALLLLVALFASAVASHAKDGAGYDPESDPWKDLKAAVVEAKAGNRRILLEVGGEWCTWCHILDNFLEQNDTVKELWSRNFVTMKVNTSPENWNWGFLGQYPSIPAYPHLFVLDSDGSFLHSQNTGELESGKSYSRDAIEAFLTTWGPQ